MVLSKTKGLVKSKKVLLKIKGLIGRLFCFFKNKTFNQQIKFFCQDVEVQLGKHKGFVVR